MSLESGGHSILLLIVLLLVVDVVVLGHLLVVTVLLSNLTLHRLEMAQIRRVHLHQCLYSLFVLRQHLNDLLIIIDFVL